MEKLVLIDGNSLLNRAYYATPLFSTKDGLPTNAVFGFVKLVLKIIADKKPSYLAVAFDLRAPTFRHELYSDYKAGRKPMPEELACQIPVLKDVLRCMQIKICELEGYEADDLLGTIAKKFDVQTYIYTGDRDAYQLVDSTTNICFTRKGVSDILELTNENFQAETGLLPNQIIDLKALMGDKSDNIPGVAGIGEKSAHTLIENYGGIDGVYEHIDEIAGALNRKLTLGKEDAYFSYRLATINTNVPIDIKLADCILKTPFSQQTKRKFTELEFRSVAAMKIFVEEDEASTDNVGSSAQAAAIEVCQPQSVESFLRKIDGKTFDYIGCDWKATELRFAVSDNPAAKQWIEYVFPIKLGLLDAGVFENELVPVLQWLSKEGQRLILYNAKEFMHRLHFLQIEMLAGYDDVSILKCLSDAQSNSDGLSFCLDYYNLSQENSAYGLVWLRNHYLAMLNREETLLYQNVELPLVRVLYDMERQGVCVDEDILDDLSVQYNREKLEIVGRIYELAGEQFNINSTQQLGRILFEKLHIGQGSKKNKDSKSYKTTAEELEKYADDSEIVQLVLRYRIVQKITSTYLDGFKPLIVKGKIHTTYNQCNTTTGRLSSANPNLQNIPIRTNEGRALRKLFKASEGHVLVDADYSQIELRLLAHFSACKELIAAYCRGDDIHAMTAAQVFEVDIKDVTPQQRREAKAVNFGIIYGISAFGLSKDLGISTKKAQGYIDKYFEKYAEVQAYTQGNVESAKENGFVTTLLGRRRVINEIKSANYALRSFGERAAMNMPLQGSSADIIKLAMLDVAEKLRQGGYRAKLVLQVHDELVIDCPKNEEAAVADLLKRSMEGIVDLLVPLEADVGVGENWFDAK